MEIRTLITFLRVAELRSFSRAAAQLVLDSLQKAG